MSDRVSYRIVSVLYTHVTANAASVAHASPPRPVCSLASRTSGRNENRDPVRAPAGAVVISRDSGIDF